MFFKKLENEKPTGNLILEENLVYILDIDFSKNPPPGLFADLGYCVFETTEPPSVDVFQKVTETDPVLVDNNVWQQQWQVKNKTASERKVATDAKKAEVEKTLQYKIDVATDHYDTEDFPAAYRAQVKDYIDALNALDTSDPFNVQWPTSPQVPPDDNVPDNVFLP